MKNSGYEEAEKEQSFSGEGRQGQALRIMEALSGVDEELLERSARAGIQQVPSDKRGRRKEGNEKWQKPLWQYAKPWAAVLCLAVVGALGWGGYQLTTKVNDGVSGESRNDMAMRAEDNGFEFDMDEAAPVTLEEEGAAPQEQAGEAEPQEMNDQKSMGNGSSIETDIDTNAAGETSTSQGTSENSNASGGREKEENEAAAEDNKLQTEEGSIKDSDVQDSVMVDSSGCPSANLQTFTETEVRSQEGLGTYLPETLPRGYAFKEAFCNLDRQETNLTVTWVRGMDSIMWSVAEAEAVPETVNVDEPESYDLRLYEVPYAETVPPEYRQSVDNPTFAWEDFSREIVDSRMISYADQGDTDTPRGSFSVVFPDHTVIHFSGRATAEEVWEMFASMKAAD